MERSNCTSIQMKRGKVMKVLIGHGKGLTFIFSLMGRLFRVVRRQVTNNLLNRIPLPSLWKIDQVGQKHRARE